MDIAQFYRRLFAPLEACCGPINPETIVAIIGFDEGGPLNFCTVGDHGRNSCITYVSCELAVRRNQIRSDVGRYELLVSCDSEEWVRSVVSDLGRMTFESRFGEGHTMDIAPWVAQYAPIQGIVFEKVCGVRIRLRSFGVIRIIGVSRRELEFAQQRGVPALMAQLKAAGIYPDTLINRASVV